MKYTSRPTGQQIMQTMMANCTILARKIYSVLSVVPQMEKTYIHKPLRFVFFGSVTLPVCHVGGLWELLNGSTICLGATQEKLY